MGSGHSAAKAGLAMVRSELLEDVLEGVSLNLLASLTRTQSEAVQVAAERYGRFLDLPISLK